MQPTQEVAIPLTVRLHFARAAAQTIADAAGIDLLHLKGDAVDPALRPAGGAGTDVDVLVRPEHIARLDGLLRAHGWSVFSTFLAGSPFGHAQTYAHPLWGYLDVHRFFPGIGLPASAAFDRLWRSRSTRAFAAVDCAVPGRIDQCVVLVLNAARSRGARAADIEMAWTRAGEHDRAAIADAVAGLHAQLAFDAATGRIERHRGEREYRLWRAVAQDGSRAAEWWGRVLAAPTALERVRVIARLPVVNTEHLAHRLGRAPSRWEVVREFVARPVRGIRELLGRGGSGA